MGITWPKRTCFSPVPISSDLLETWERSATCLLHYLNASFAETPPLPHLSFRSLRGGFQRDGIPSVPFASGPKLVIPILPFPLYPVRQACNAVITLSDAFSAGILTASLTNPQSPIHVSHERWEKPASTARVECRRHHRRG